MQGSRRAVSAGAVGAGRRYEQPDIAAVVAKTTELVIQQTIDIPRILVVPKGEVRVRLQAIHAGAGHR